MADRRGAEGREDDRLRLVVQSGQLRMSFHKLDKAKDKNFWSVRVSSDIRLIVHKSEESLLLCYVGHHDKAYDWAERRKMETHPKTALPSWYVEAPKPASSKKPLFGKISDDDLLNDGVPAEWMNDVRQATDDTLLRYCRCGWSRPPSSRFS